MSLVTQIDLNITALLTKTLDLSTPLDNLVKKVPIRLATGTAANQADMLWHDTRTLAASATEDLDLAGVLVDGLGTTETFKTIKVIIISAATGNTNNVVAGNAASNQFPGSWGTTGTCSTAPGGETWCISPKTGWTVTAGTGDLLKIANSAAGTSVTYDIIVIGTTV
jgi:hypothetical protein